MQAAKLLPAVRLYNHKGHLPGTHTTFPYHPSCEFNYCGGCLLSWAISKGDTEQLNRLQWYPTPQARLATTLSGQTEPAPRDLLQEAKLDGV